MDAAIALVYKHKCILKLIKYGVGFCIGSSYCTNNAVCVPTHTHTYIQMYKHKYILKLMKYGVGFCIGSSYCTNNAVCVPTHTYIHMYKHKCILKLMKYGVGFCIGSSYLNNRTKDFLLLTFSLTFWYILQKFL